MNYAIIGRVSEVATLLAGIRRDVDQQREDFRRQQDMTREFITLIREQNLLMKQMIETKNKP